MSGYLWSSLILLEGVVITYLSAACNIIDGSLMTPHAPSFENAFTHLGSIEVKFREVTLHLLTGLATGVVGMAPVKQKKGRYLPEQSIFVSLN